MLRKLAVLASLLMATYLSAIAQDSKPADTDADKEKKQTDIDKRVVQLLDQLVFGADSLRLQQNRAIVYGVTGDLYWKYDEKRARELFRNAANELTAYNLEADRERRDRPMMEDLFSFGSATARNEILPLVAKHDAELALELLVQTRPSKLAEAMTRASVPNSKGQSDMMNFDGQRISQELALEQRFALAAADTNPEKAIKLIKDSLSKGISPNVLTLLEKLSKTDSKKAAEVGGDVIKKILDTDLAKSDDDMRSAASMLQYAYKPKAAANPKDKGFAFTDQQVKDLANKIANALLQPSRSMSSAMMLSQLTPTLEKYVPEKSSALRQRQVENDSMMPSEVKSMQQRQALFDPTMTAEDIAAQLPKLTNEFDKTMAYSMIGSKAGDMEDEAKAKKLIDQIPDEKARNGAMDQFEAGRITRAAGAGKLDDAKKLIGNLTKRSMQVQRLVEIAFEFQKKGGEKETAMAMGLMKDARALITEPPETSDQMNDYMQVVRGYAKVEPNIGFKLFEQTVGQFNELLDASAVMARFDASQSAAFKKGEIEMRISPQSYSLAIFRYIPHMQMLAKADLDRMNTVVDRFTRDDVRIMVRLYVLQGFLKESKELDQPIPTDYPYPY